MVMVHEVDSMEWTCDFVKSAATRSRHHKARVSSRNLAQANHLDSGAARKTAKVDRNAVKVGKPHQLGQGSKGRNLFAYDNDEWLEDLEDEYYHENGYFWPRILQQEQPEDNTQNAWIIFEKVSQNFSVPARQGLQGKSCAICCEGGIPLWMNLGCGDVACLPCWRWWLAQFPRCARLIFGVPCFMPGCRDTLSIPARSIGSVSKVPWGPICLLVKSADPNDVEGSFSDGRQAPSDAVCALCCESSRPLLQNSCCSASACGSCWQRWVSSQLPRCRAARQLNEIPCFVPGCRKAMRPPLLRRACATSVKGFDLICDLAVRRRLQSNPFYPPEMQEDCPRPGCLGLGYLGFDHVMCWICEHRWVSVGKGPSEDDLPNGVKKCPRCKVRISKDGGCDHMTCAQCRHEFWWTTLAPYP